MKLKYLGTAAAEGFPAIFCNCDHCKAARALGGKNIRTRSQTLINSDLLIDLPADTYMHFLQNGIEGDLIKYLVITHAHLDHLYRNELMMRIPPVYANSPRNEKLRVFCSGGTAKYLEEFPEAIEINVLKPFETARAGEYELTALPARHMPGGEPFIYIIKGDKTLLYAHDTGYFFDEVFDYIEKNKLKFDFVSLDCTNGDLQISDTGGHMGFANIDRVLKRLVLMGAVNESTTKYINHFSHNANPRHDLLEEKAKELGLSVSYDGCEVEF